MDEIRELVILSTCSRVELYAATTSDCFDTLESFLFETQNIPAAEFSASLYRLQSQNAIQHLLQVAAGLDSVVLGEPQILGQVTDAYSSARRYGTAGKILSRLFQAAIQAGKRARTETAISHNAASVASVAVRLISQSVPDLPAARIMVLGAGDMAELAVEALRKRGANQILVVNRTLQRAQELAQRWNGQAASFEMLLELLPDTDIVITSTGAAHTVIQASMVARAMEARPNRPLVFMDIAVPRDVEPEVAQISDVNLFDMDTITEQLKTAQAQRQAEVPQGVLEDPALHRVEALLVGPGGDRLQRPEQGLVLADPGGVGGEQRLGDAMRLAQRVPVHDPLQVLHGPPGAPPR